MIIAHLEMLTYVGVARALAQSMPVRRLIPLAGRAGDSLHRLWPAAMGAHEAIAQAERTAHRASRLVPGAACMHRALAARVFLARRGVASELVVGLRKTGALEGHAWLEVEVDGGHTALFVTEEAGYRESFRESSVALAG